MRSLLAAVFLLSVGAAQAQAKITARTYAFENTYGQRIQCIVSRYNSVEERQIATINSSSFEVDRAPSAQTWAKSGCAAYVSSQTRLISPQEQRERMNAVGRAPSFYGPGGLRDQIVELMCADPKNAGSAECIGRPPK